jgi:Flp pilus assembly protein TadG
MAPERPPGRGAPPAGSTSRRRPRSDDRGQTTIDFAVGATLFLLTMAFVFAFVPAMFQPFATSQSDSLVADRAANRLATDVLGTPGEPYVLDTTCTTAFFAGNPPPTGCAYAYDTAGDHPHLALGVGADTTVNVTLVDPSSGVVFTAGDDLANARDVITAQRRVSYDGKSHELYVRVW